MAKVREKCNERENGKPSRDGLSQHSPWLTTLIANLLGPLIVSVTQDGKEEDSLLEQQTGGNVRRAEVTQLKLGVGLPTW